MIRVTQDLSSVKYENEVILVQPSTIVEIRPISSGCLHLADLGFRLKDGDDFHGGVYAIGINGAKPNSAIKSAIIRLGKLETLYVMETVDEIYQQLSQLH